MTTPVLRALKEQLEGNTEVHFLTKKSYVSVLDGNKNIDVIHSIEEDIDEIKDVLFNENFDYIIDLHKNIRSARVKNHLKRITFSVDKLNYKKFLLVAFGIDKLPEVHIVDRYRDTLKGFGVIDDGKGLDYAVPDSEKISPSSEDSRFSAPYISWAIGATHEGKRMPAEKVAEIIQSLHQQVVLIGGPEDEETGEEIVKLAGNNAWNACGKYSLHQSASWVEQSELLITGDTGMMHLGAALGKKIISLWGCTSPKFGMYPYRPHPDSIIIEPDHLKKRPCSKLGNHCKYGMERRCISQIENGRVVEAVRRLAVGLF